MVDKGGCYCKRINTEFSGRSKIVRREKCIEGVGAEKKINGGCRRGWNFRSGQPVSRRSVDL